MTVQMSYSSLGKSGLNHWTDEEYRGMVIEVKAHRNDICLKLQELIIMFELGNSSRFQSYSSPFEFESRCDKASGRAVRKELENVGPSSLPGWLLHNHPLSWHAVSEEIIEWQRDDFEFTTESAEEVSRCVWMRLLPYQGVVRSMIDATVHLSGTPVMPLNVALLLETTMCIPGEEARPIYVTTVEEHANRQGRDELDVCPISLLTWLILDSEIIKEMPSLVAPARHYLLMVLSQMVAWLPEISQREADSLPAKSNDDSGPFADCLCVVQMSVFPVGFSLLCPAFEQNDIRLHHLDHRRLRSSTR